MIAYATIAGLAALTVTYFIRLRNSKRINQVLTSQIEAMNMHQQWAHDKLDEYLGKIEDMSGLVTTGLVEMRSARDLIAHLQDDNQLLMEALQQKEDGGENLEDWG